MSDDSGPSKPCVFCAIVNNRAPADIVWRSHQVVAFTPLNPHAPGHVLFVPRDHVVDARENMVLTAETMIQASVYAAGLKAANIITSCGKAATQSVFHLHIHVVPRSEHDGLPAGWPWA